MAGSLPSLWADRAGILIQFSSFWLIAPEIIGEDQLMRLRTVLVRVFSASLVLIVTIGMVAIAWSLAFREGMHWFHKVGWALLFSLIVLVPKLLFYKTLKEKWLPYLVEHLSSDQHFRRGLMLIGGVLFTLGSALQFVATFL